MLDNISGSPTQPSEGQGLHSKTENTEIDWSQADVLIGCTKEEGESLQDQGTGVLAWEGMPSRQILGKEVGTKVCSTHTCTADNRQVIGKPHTSTIAQCTLFIRGRY